MNKLGIEEVIRRTIFTLYNESIFNHNFLLKGGQAVRIKEDIKHRFSVDIDASIESTIKDPDTFFVLFKKSLQKEFKKSSLEIIDFKPLRKPKKTHPDSPAFWTGWLIEFKLISIEKINLPKERLSREAIIPDGVASPTITIELSEHEYCGDYEEYTLEVSNGEKVTVYSYSTSMLIVEKMRAICQQHHDYPHRKKRANRARDFFDIAKLIEKETRKKRINDLKEKCSELIKPIFSAKEVDVNLIDKIFEDEFIKVTEQGWRDVQLTVKNGNNEVFEVYVDILKDFVKSVKKENFNIASHK